MAGPLNAKVILARCSKTRKSYGIRIEERHGDWELTWAFPLDEGKAKREGYGAETVNGSMKPDDKYPGCPHCGSKGFSQDTNGCGKVHCDGGGIDKGNGELEMTCPWCGKTDLYVPCSEYGVASGSF